MASADYRSGIPVLPATPPQTEMTSNGLGWLLYALNSLEKETLLNNLYEDRFYFWKQI